jgi:Lhr-like helicase
MAVAPGTYNFTLQRRADYSLDLQFKDSNDAVVDLTGYTVYAQAWNEGRTTKYADFSVAYTNRTNGQITISLTDTQTATFPDELRYDVLLEDSGGTREYYLEGIIFVSQGYTAP